MKSWRDLSARTRRVLVIGAITEGIVKIVALVDLRRRPAAQVRGSKARWALAIVGLNSAGLVPALYFTRGRRP